VNKLWLLVILFSAGCGFISTPDDFPPPPPMTPIVEWPQVTATVTLEPRMHAILPSDLDDAETFFLIIKTSMAAGDDVGIAERVKYPVHVKVNGQEIVLNNQRQFLDQYDNIFDQGFVQVLAEIDESELTLLPNGMQVGHGALWFNSFCVDLSCSDAEFQITQINK
jgi:hypothetical protein